MSSTFFIPAVNIMGIGCLDEAMSAIRNYGFRKALIVTDTGLAKAGVASMVAEKLAMQDIDSVIFDGAKPNPSIANVEQGLAQLQQAQCDFVISLGGGSPHDCAKGIALCATNGGQIRDYEGGDQSAKPQLPLIAINTPAGTASEMTRFCIITDESRHVKMAIVDRNVTPLLSVNDPALMVAMPKGLTAATGMDALTHHIEAFCSPLYHPMSSAIAVEGMRLVQQHLRRAVSHGQDLDAREGMLVASAMAAVAFQKGLGGVHALAHPLGARYHRHHGLLNAVLLPYVLVANQPVIAEEIGRLARYLDLPRGDFQGFLDWILALRAELGIPHCLADIGLDSHEAEWVGAQALADISSSDTNARPLSAADYSQIFRNAVHGVLPGARP